ncbi:DOPA 4,5-dioxygenase family protein [Dongia sp.]|uniref:DOPA 4,5-dioxygenase family protein n=1 Tax=Dongia sp. TaxID=1977262 RepID=UPI0035B153FB
MTPRQIAEVASYHAHIYFEGPAQRAHAMELRERIAERFSVALGRVHDKLVGPHVRPMYQVSFDIATFASFVPWLMLNRGDLAVLVHPNTGRELADHIAQGLWMGEVLPLTNLDMLQAETVAEEPRTPNTAPTLTP